MSPLLLLKIVVPDTNIFAPASITVLELSKLIFGFYFHPLIACIPSIFIAITLALSVDRFFYKPFRPNQFRILLVLSEN